MKLIACFMFAISLISSAQAETLKIPADKPFAAITFPDDWEASVSGDTIISADCLFEIGRVHAHEGNRKIAREFLFRALPLAQEADDMRGFAGITSDDRLEGRIAELLVQLPEDSEHNETSSS